MTLEPHRRDSSSESVRTPSMSNRMAWTGWGGAAEAAAAAEEEEGGEAAREVEVERCRGRGALVVVDDEFLLLPTPAAALPPLPVRLLVEAPRVLLRPMPLAASPNIQAPVIFWFGKERGKRRFDGVLCSTSLFSFAPLSLLFFSLPFLFLPSRWPPRYALPLFRLPLAIASR